MAPTTASKADETTVLEDAGDDRSLVAPAGGLSRAGVAAVNGKKKISAEDEEAALNFFLDDDNDVPDEIVLEITRTCKRDEADEPILGTGIKLVHRPIMEDELKKLQKRAATGERMANGNKAVDLILLYRLILIATMTVPNLRSQEMLLRHGSPEDGLKAKVRPGEIEKLAEMVMVESGFSDDSVVRIKDGEDDVSLAKN